MNKYMYKHPAPADYKEQNKKLVEALRAIYELPGVQCDEAPFMAKKALEAIDQ